VCVCWGVGGSENGSIFFNGGNSSKSSDPIYF